MRKRILSSSLTACLALSSVAVVAADDSFSVSELAPIYRNYADPLYTSVGSFMGAGWSHTAEVHKFPGFDLTIGATFAKMPSSVGTFNLGNIGLDKTKYFGNGNTSIEKLTAPTFTNDGDVKAPELYRNLAGKTEIKIPMLDGNDLGFLGVPLLQVGVGLPFGTEIQARFMPGAKSIVDKLLDDEDFSVDKLSMWGVGVKHDIKQWIPVISHVPFLQISCQLTYAKFKSEFSGDKLSLKPSDFKSGLPDGNQNWKDQSIAVGISSFTGTLMVGASIPVFQPYVGLGFNNCKNTTQLNGSYPKFSYENSLLTYEVEKDPVDIEVKDTHLNTMMGFRLKFAVAVLYYQFDIQPDYKTHTAGLAITIR